ncbi:MAG TPA: YhjD/YihY/BrkB family envelope integrity protein [Thermoanaerobaculia bacterium]|jgi:membrane protein
MSTPQAPRSNGPPVRSRPSTQVFAVAGRDVFREAFRGFKADRGPDLAGSLAFATILAAVPLLATFSLFAATFFRNNVDEIYSVLNVALPYQAARLTENLRTFVDDSLAISGIGLAVLVLASLRLAFEVEAIFNAVWGAPRRRRLFGRIAIYTLSLVAFALFVGGLSLVYEVLSRVPILSILLDSPAAELLLPIVAQFAGLSIAYRYLPNARVRWASAFSGAGFATLLLQLLRLFFGFYVDALSKMNLITGTLTLLMLTLLSIFLVWMIVLFGVELTHVLETGRVRVGLPVRGASGTVETAVRMLIALARGESMNEAELAERVGVPREQAEQQLTALSKAGLVEGDRITGHRLTRRASQITVAQVVEAVSPELYAIAGGTDEVTKALRHAFARLAFERRFLLDITIAELRAV